MNGGTLMLQKEKITYQLGQKETWLAQAETQPLPTLRALAFQAFLERHALTLLDVAMAGGIRLLTVWKVAHDLPISPLQAASVRAGLARLTGECYRGGITVYPPFLAIHEQKQIGDR